MNFGRAFFPSLHSLISLHFIIFRKFYFFPIFFYFCTLYFNLISLNERGIHIVFFIAIASIVSTVFVANNFLFHGDTMAKCFWFATAMCFFVLLFPFFISKNVVIRVTDILFYMFAFFVCVNYFILNGHPNMHWWLTLLMFPLYVGFRGFLDRCNNKFKESFLVFLLVVFLVKALWGLAQLYGFARSYNELFSITGTFFNPGPYSGFLALGVPLALGFSLDKGLSRMKRSLGFVCLVAIFLILPSTMSRASWVAAFAGGLVVVFQFYGFRFMGSCFRFLQSVSLRITMVIMVGSLVVGLFAGAYKMKKESVDGRILLWSVSLEAVKDHPLFGSGYGRFAAVYGDAQATYFIQNRTEDQILRADITDYGFNEYVQIAVELGIVGLVLFFLLVGSVFNFKNLKSNSDNANLKGCPYILASFVAFLFFAAFSYPFSVLPLAILFVFFLALLAPSSGKISFIVPVWLQVVVIALCWCIAAYSAYQILSTRESYYQWSEFRVFQHNYNKKETSKKYAALYPYLKHDKYFLFEYGKFLCLTGKHEESNRKFNEYFYYGSDPMAHNYTGFNFMELGEYNNSVNAYIHALHIVPNRFYPLYMLMKLYEKIGNGENAKICAKLILEKPIKVPSPEVTQMQNEARILLNQ